MPSACAALLSGMGEDGGGEEGAGIGTRISCAASPCVMLASSPYERDGEQMGDEGGTGASSVFFLTIFLVGVFGGSILRAESVGMVMISLLVLRAGLPIKSIIIKRVFLGIEKGYSPDVLHIQCIPSFAYSTPKSSGKSHFFSNSVIKCLHFAKLDSLYQCPGASGSPK